MSALPYQPVPTLAQRKALHADHAKRYARQYRDNQDEAIAEMQAARLRYEMGRNAEPNALTLTEHPEPCQFCAIPTPGEDGEPQVWEWVGSTPVLIIVALACVAWVIYWSAP